MGAIAWDLDDARTRSTAQPSHSAQRFDAQDLGLLEHPRDGQWEAPDEAPRPWFYTWSLMGRLFPKGSRIVAASLAETCPASAHWPRRGRRAAPIGWSVMLVRRCRRAAVLDRARARAGKRALVGYHYFDTDRPVDRDGFPVASATLPKPFPRRV